MKRKSCMTCLSQASYESNNCNLLLCEECYLSLSDDFEASMEEECGMSFDEYYEIEEIPREF